MNELKKEAPRTIPAESDTHRRPGPCSHKDIVGDSALEDYAGVLWCTICGERFEEVR